MQPHVPLTPYVVVVGDGPGQVDPLQPHVPRHLSEEVAIHAGGYRQFIIKDYCIIGKNIRVPTVAEREGAAKMGGRTRNWNIIFLYFFY